MTKQILLVLPLITKSIKSLIFYNFYLLSRFAKLLVLIFFGFPGLLFNLLEKNMTLEQP